MRSIDIIQMIFGLLMIALTIYANIIDPRPILTIFCGLLGILSFIHGAIDYNKEIKK